MPFPHFPRAKDSLKRSKLCDASFAGHGQSPAMEGFALKDCSAWCFSAKITQMAVLFAQYEAKLEVVEDIYKEGVVRVLMGILHLVF